MYCSAHICNSFKLQCKWLWFNTVFRQILPCSRNLNWILHLRCRKRILTNSSIQGEFIKPVLHWHHYQTFAYFLYNPCLMTSFFRSRQQTTVVLRSPRRLASTLNGSAVLHPQPCHLCLMSLSTISLSWKMTKSQKLLVWSPCNGVRPPYGLTSQVRRNVFFLPSSQLRVLFWQKKSLHYQCNSGTVASLFDPWRPAHSSHHGNSNFQRMLFVV